MQCHKCPFSEQNGGSLQDRERHCLDCDFTEIYPKPAFPIDTPLAEALVNHESLQGYASPDSAGEADPSPTPTEAEAETEVEKVANSEFVRRFAMLNWRSQQVVLGILNVGDSNKRINEMTRMAVSTIILHRKRLEADPYWGRLLEGLSIRRRERRKRSKRPPATKTHDCNGRFVESGRGGGRRGGRGAEGEVLPERSFRGALGAVGKKC